MNYDQLRVRIPTVEISLGRDRTAEARMLGAAVQLAVHRAIPEPEPPIIGKDPVGNHIRDDGASSFESAMLEWRLRSAALLVAVSIGYEPEGASWETKHLVEPHAIQGRQGDASRLEYKNAEESRRVYARLVVRDFLGDGRVEGLLSKDELIEAATGVQSIGMGELIGQSAEGNSSSGPRQDPAAPPTQD